MLGFGLEVVGASFLTPIALAVTKEVVEFLANEVKKSVEAESAGVIGELVKRMFKKFRPAEEKKAPSLTQEQIMQVRNLAFEKGRQLNLPEVQAGLLADSLAGSLVTRPGVTGGTP